MSKKIKVSTWLASHESHGIYDAGKAADDLKKKTGVMVAGDWNGSAFDLQAHARAILASGGQLNGEPQTGTRGIGGYQMARVLADKLINFHSSKMGRGFAFHDCIDALKRKGK